ncbi:uncharacterized protein LOC110097065 isoform X1 [Dendrobium catenatum]|uniref:uncharacterized protein LOC110097065 isoform X1 n=2 Tax=Dendrobium catenatum TaxID=906689 RepID=UPI00109F3980|nr:uncharacterized protein LOC110097065 isoform X1 [Dendrobium catenatum]XP_020678944.2 uncharacterized protein LOC110097065 isoform X1 [Dendrobium catenatum]
MLGKLGRGSNFSGKRAPSMPVQLHRTGETGGTRNPIGAPAPARVRPGPQTVAGAVPGREETFSLEPGELDFGAIIRLTPDIIEEIRRLEAQGGSAKIKFDANANNAAGNVVEVGGKEFRFTWSQELPGLCDIYEERRNGDDGDGLLVECGAAWRKLNVQRILDESTKNHVKMRSEEAKRVNNSRKAIVLDPTNPSVKSQAKSMAAAAVEGNMRGMGWKHKKEMLFKKPKVENKQGVAAVSQTKSVSKSAIVSNGNFKGIPSPIPSPQQPRPRALLSTSGTGNALRGDMNTGEINPTLNINKEEIEVLEREVLTRVSRGSMQDINGHEGGQTDPSIDLRSMLITLLTQNPKGMSLKALEKAVGERFPNSVKRIEIVLKTIAIFQAPGRYFLKQGGQVESSKKCSEGGSSPECLNKQTTRAASVLSEKANDESLDQETLSSKHGEGPDLFEGIDRMHDSEDPLDIEGEIRGSSVVRASSSSESASDSDSESDSSSESGSGSKSGSPAGSGSASSSDSETNGSSSSKEVSDMDVDIMTSDDDKGVAAQRMDATMSTLSKLPGVWTSGGEYDINDSVESDQKANAASPALDFVGTDERVNSVSDAKNLIIGRSTKSIEKQEAKTVESIDSYMQQSKSRSSVDGIQFSKDHNQVMENQHASSFVNSCNDGDKFFGRKASNEKQILMKDGTGDQPGNRERVPKTSSKRTSNAEYLQEKPKNAKRMKASSSAETSFGKEKGALSSENLCYLSPERYRHLEQKIKMTNNQQKDEKSEADLLEGSLLEHARSAASGSTDRVQSSPDFRDAANLAVEQSSRKVADSSRRKKTLDVEKPAKYAESFGRANKPLQTVCGPTDSDASTLKNSSLDRISTVKGKPDENSDSPEKHRAKITKEIFVGEKTLSAPDQINRKSTDGYISDLHNSDVNGKGNVLRRELSDLELGELCEPLTEVMGEDKRQFERNNSFKKMDNRATVSEANTADVNMGKSDVNAFSESKRQSPNRFREGVNGKVSNDGLDLSRSQSRLVQAQFRQSSRMDVAEDKCVESGGKNGTRTDQLLGLENEASGPKKYASSRMLKDDNRHDGLVDRKIVKESKSQKSNGLKGSTDRGIDVSMTYNNTESSRKSLESSSDEENAPYMKYEKDALCLGGPIKDFSMYKDYVRVFQERYSHYCSLNKKLEKTRNDFLKVGDDIELARGRDMEEYYKLVEKLRQMYHQRGERHKEMKKIFILLHDELKTLKQRIKDFAAAHSGE